MKWSDFSFIPSDDPFTEDDEYRHKSDPRLSVQACVYGRYFVPVIQEGDGWRHLPDQPSLKAAIAALAVEVDA